MPDLNNNYAQVNVRIKGSRGGKRRNHRKIFISRGIEGDSTNVGSSVYQSLGPVDNSLAGGVRGCLGGGGEGT